MVYTHFEIVNFKGIEHIHFELTRNAVQTFVGLNESGKTTILEAINLLSYRESLDALNLPGYRRVENLHDFIPISKRDNFNGDVIIKAGLRLSEGDIRKVASKLLREHQIKDVEMNPDFEITQKYSFTASQARSDKPNIQWSLFVQGRPPRHRNSKRLTGSEWSTVVSLIRPLIPRLAYFPNFLFDFPDRIYLEKAPHDDDRHMFYRTVLQDVLDALDNDLDLNEHVLQRAKSTASHASSALESVTLKMGDHISKTVFRQWDQIFKGKGGGKEIVVSLAQDDAKLWYVRLRLRENSELYEISERSLGFRWFFTYLLLTQYRGFRQSQSSPVTFLLDEPASNLHPSAQSRLLESFANLPRGCSVVYTTHSHHMVKPEWLDGTFVVKNEALQYDGDDTDFSPRRAVISLHRYRTFAAKHPDQTTYFRPVLDVLDYAPSRLDLVPEVAMLEGKSDYYALRLMQKIIVATGPHLNLLPGRGAGGLDSVIQLYLGWGRNFVVLLDGDREGRLQKERYQERFGPEVGRRILLLEEINAEWVGYRLEQLVDPKDMLAIQRTAYPAELTYSKNHFHRAIAELVVSKNIDLKISTTTRKKFQLLFDALASKLQSLD